MDFTCTAMLFNNAKRKKSNCFLYLKAATAAVLSFFYDNVDLFGLFFLRNRNVSDANIRPNPRWFSQKQNPESTIYYNSH